jgi:hypothetical protein
LFIEMMVNFQFRPLIINFGYLGSLTIKILSHSRYLSVAVLSLYVPSQTLSILIYRGVQWPVRCMASSFSHWAYEDHRMPSIL